jgi:hypothetical protein
VNGDLKLKELKQKLLSFEGGRGRETKTDLAEWSKALCLGRSSKERGFESPSPQIFWCLIHSIRHFFFNILRLKRETPISLSFEGIPRVHSLCIIH